MRSSGRLVATSLGLLLAGPAWSADYKVGAGDTLDIRVYDEPELSGEVQVSDACTVSLALIRRVKVCGKTTAELELLIAEAYDGDYLLQPSVSVQVKEFQSQRVDVLGSVNRPGPHFLEGKTSLIEVISLAGGPSADNVVEVEVVRGEASETYSLPELSAGDTVFVEAGDKVFLKPGKVVYLDGTIRNPGAVVLTEGLTVTQALALAGGPDDGANLRRLLLLRADGEKMRINLNRIHRGVDEDPLLQPDDQLIVPRSAVF